MRGFLQCRVGINVLYIGKDSYTLRVFFMYERFPILNGSFLLSLASYIYESILCMTVPILPKSVICTIMGPSYVHQLLWGLTPVHKR